MNLNLRPKEECTFDEISLGEIMLRLDPGEGRIKTARSFRAWEGGGPYLNDTAKCSYERVPDGFVVMDEMWGKAFS